MSRPARLVLIALAGFAALAAPAAADAGSRHHIRISFLPGETADRPIDYHCAAPTDDPTGMVCTGAARHTGKGLAKVHVAGEPAGRPGTFTARYDTYAYKVTIRFVAKDGGGYAFKSASGKGKAEGAWLLAQPRGAPNAGQTKAARAAVMGGLFRSREISVTTQQGTDGEPHAILRSTYDVGVAYADGIFAARDDTKAERERCRVRGSCHARGACGSGKACRISFEQDVTPASPDDLGRRATAAGVVRALPRQAVHHESSARFTTREGPGVIAARFQVHPGGHVWAVFGSVTAYYGPAYYCSVVIEWQGGSTVLSAGVLSPYNPMLVVSNASGDAGPARKATLKVTCTPTHAGESQVVVDRTIEWR